MLLPRPGCDRPAHVSQTNAPPQVRFLLAQRKAGSPARAMRCQAERKAAVAGDRQVRRHVWHGRRRGRMPDACTGAGPLAVAGIKAEK